MNTLDIVLAVIVLLGLARGFQKGLIKSFIGLIGWLVALVVASKMAGQAGHFFADWVDSQQLQIALGFLLIVLVIITLLQIIGAILNKLLAELNLTILDRFGGGVFGAARSVLIILILLSLTAPLLSRFAFWKNSVFVPQLLPFAPVAMQFSKDIMNKTVPNMVPEELRKNDADKQEKSPSNAADNDNKQPTNTNTSNDDISIDDISVINDEAFTE